MNQVYVKDLISYCFLSAMVFLPGCNCGDSNLGELSSQFSVTPEILRLPSKPIGVQSTATLTLVNSGETVLSIVDTTVTSTVFSLKLELPQTLAPAESIIITVTANAEQVGVHQANAAFQTSDNGPRANVSLLYESVQKPPCDDGNICTQD